MARRRVVANSSDEAEQPSVGVACLNEEDVLKPVAKELHPDKWPCFVLEGAVVYGKDGKTLVNLLDAELEGPLTVRGRLEVDREFRHLQKITSLKDREIEVTDVKGFSMGIGPVTIWANGKAGWFEIRPAPIYEQIFDKMEEGVTLYYFLTDIYESKKNVSGDRSLHINQIFDQYSKQFDGPMTPLQVAQRCEEHAVFLLSQMRKPHEPVRWSRTSFHHWLVERCPQIYDRYQGNIDHKEARTLSASTETHRDAVLDYKRNSKSSVASSPTKHRKRRSSSTTLIVRTMNELHKSGKLRRQNMNLRRLSRALYERYDIVSETMAQEVVKVQARSLFIALGADWATSPIYIKLEELLGQPEKRTSNLRREARRVVLCPRFHDDESVCNGIDNESHTPSETVPAFGRRRKRSSQSEQDGDSTSSESRSHQHKTSNKGKGKQVAENNVLLPTRRASSRSGKVAALRLANSSVTRDQLTPFQSGDKREDGHSRKRPKISHSSMDDDAEAAESSNDSSPDLEPEDLEEEEAIEAKEELTLISEPLPSASPQGPNGLWECQREGCGCSIAAADKPEGRAKVHAHFLEHADEIAARENLVRKESRPYLPINHLLEKLRSLGEAARLAEQNKIGGRVVPDPIKNRLMV